MTQKPPDLKETPSQTAGPYVHIGLAPRAAGFDMFTRKLGEDIAGPSAKGERIRLEGYVIDATGAPIKDALLEVWQANAQGIYAHPESKGEAEPGFRGWGRAITDFETGKWHVDTIKPGPTPLSCSGDPVRMQSPHITLWLVARGINIGLHTRLYFDDEDNSQDPVLSEIEPENRRKTLLAQKIADGLYRFDINIQGEDETVFFDI